MSNTVDGSPERVPRAIEREMSLIREAIALVAGGESVRVVVANIHFADALLGDAQDLAAEAGVRVVALWTLDESSRDIAVERLDA